MLDRLAAFADTRRAILLVACWAVAEAILWPVVPDVVLGILVLARPSRTGWLFAGAVAGGLVGTLVLYAATLVAPDVVSGLLLRLPGIDAAMVAQARVTVSGGSPASLVLFGPGTPLKVYTYAWATGPATLLPYLVGVVLNRVTRILPTLLALAAVGALAPGFLRRHERVVVAAYAIAWIVLYAGYWGLR